MTPLTPERKAEIRVRADAAASKHRQRCEKEATRDVIFLFQVRDLRWTGKIPDGFELIDGRHLFHEGADHDADEPLSLADLYREAGNEYAVESWRTVTVFLDRQEAEAWGVSQQHNYGPKYVGESSGDRCWQVYGVPAHGELAVMLQGGTDVPDLLAETDRLEALVSDYIKGIEATNRQLTAALAAQRAAEAEATALRERLAFWIDEVERADTPRPRKWHWIKQGLEIGVGAQHEQDAGEIGRLRAMVTDYEAALTGYATGPWGVANGDDTFTDANGNARKRLAQFEDQGGSIALAFLMKHRDKSQDMTTEQYLAEIKGRTTPSTPGAP